MGYAQRLERDSDVGVKEAFKVLHQGLSCLAGQITATDSHSANIAAQLTNNWEQLARRISEIRADLDDAHRDLDARLVVAEKSGMYNSSATDHAFEKIEALVHQRSVDQAENQRYVTRQEQAFERLTDAILKLERRLPNSDLIRRIGTIEQAFGEITDKNKTDNSTQIMLSALQALTHRLEAVEKDHGSLLAELNARSIETVSQMRAPSALPSIDEPPLVEAPPELAESTDAPDFEDVFAPHSETQNFLSRARKMSSIAPEAPKQRYLFPAGLALFAVAALITGLALNQRAKNIVSRTPDQPTATVSLPEPPNVDDTEFVVAPQPGQESVNPSNLQPAENKAVVAHPNAPVPQQQQQLRNSSANTTSSEVDPNQPVAKASAPSIDRVQQLANLGNPLALTILGLRAADGADGVAINLPDAVKYLTDAAEKGQAVAQYRLGTFYERGQGVTVDLAKAAHWYELSANQGNRKAMHNLAVFYASKKNMAEAARWFAKAAVLGLSDSQFNLAVLYERGDGVPQSLIEAFKWYSIAAAAGDIESKVRVGVLQTQLNDADKATAAKAIDAFRALPMDHGANVPPLADELPLG